MRRIYTILILLFVGITFSYGQRKVSGKVISTGDKLGLPGVTVMVKGQSVGTITDFDGNYSLDIPESAEILVFSFIGMQTQFLQPC